MVGEGALFFQHGEVSVFQSRDEALGVAEGRVLHIRAEGGAEVAKFLWILREVGGDADVVGRRGCDEFRVSDGVEEADTDAREVSFAGERDDGDTHPESFAGGGSAAVGEGIEGNIDFVVAFQVVERLVFEARDTEAVGGDAAGGKVVDDALADTWVDEGFGF